MSRATGPISCPDLQQREWNRVPTRVSFVWERSQTGEREVN